MIALLGILTALTGSALCAWEDYKNKGLVPVDLLYGFWLVALVVCIATNPIWIMNMAFAALIFLIFLTVGSKSYGPADAHVFAINALLLPIHVWVAALFIACASFLGYATGTTIYEGKTLKDLRKFKAPYLPFWLLGLIWALMLWAITQ